MESQALCIIQAAVEKRHPVCVFGVPGCGKSRLIDLSWVATYPSESLKHNGPVSVNIDDSFDAKTLVGFFRSSQTIVGRFEWVDGLLVELMKKGRWLVFEDVDKVSADILSILPRPGDIDFNIPEIGVRVPIHPDFAILGTMSVNFNRNSMKRVTRNIPGWLMVECHPPSNLHDLISAQLPSPLVVDLLLSTYTSLIDFSSKSSSMERKFGLHDLFKLISRIKPRIEKLSLSEDSVFLTEFQRVQIGREFVDLFASHAPSTDKFNQLVLLIEDCVECGPGSLVDPCPTFSDTDPTCLQIGEIKIPFRKGFDSPNIPNFTLTSVHSRMMQSIANASLINGEAVLCVGDTGTGKTTTIQFLAKKLGVKMFVYNFSDQTEGSDLIGGLKPVHNVEQVVEECFHLLQLSVEDKTIKSATDVVAYITKKLESREMDSVMKSIEKTAQKMITTISDHETLSRWNSLLTKCRSSGKFFSFVEGPLVQAARSGDWILLDEINLAPSDVLRILNNIIENKTIVIAETGQEILVHPEFRLFAAMNPPHLGRGKKSLPDSVRSRFTELYCPEVLNRTDLIKIVYQSLERDLTNTTLEKLVSKIVDLYMELKTITCNQLSSLEGGAPVFSLRSLSRAMEFAKRLLRSPKRPVAAVGDGTNEIVDGLKVSLTSSIDSRSEEIVIKRIDEVFGSSRKISTENKSQSPHIVDEEKWVQIEGHWISKGGSFHDSSSNSSFFIATQSVCKNLKKFSICLAGGPSPRPPILCEGPTGAGKTSIISFIARISCHKLVRINNHEHTDLQDYFGQYVSGPSGSLTFQEGPLVSAVRNGWWVLLDELNLAPTEVLEALNRLLDDNRELIVPETSEVIKAHPDFVLLASQNPVTLDYAGRKQLSRAFRNRFIEIQVDELPSSELGVILGSKCRLAESTANRILSTYVELSRLRRLDRVLSGRDSALVTVRDLLRWALRAPTTREEIALEGYLVLAERLRTEDQKQLVVSVLETKIGVKNLKQIVENFYESESNKVYTTCAAEFAKSGLVRTRALDRVLALISRSVSFGESILMVGETGTGKTTAVQLVAELAKTHLRIINCHQHLESSDLLGAVGPVPGGHQLQWQDGPLIESCRAGSWLLLDEVNLADDSVVERLNSLLDIDYRAITLAEKPNEETVVASKDFRLFCTMNPGNDFGKKELSAALRNRFTEIWVPSVEFHIPVDPLSTSSSSMSWSSGYSMIHSILNQHQLGNNDDQKTYLAATKICTIMQFAIEKSLGNATTRDAILWAQFVAKAVSLQGWGKKWMSLDQVIAHGGAVVLLDSIESHSSDKQVLLDFFGTQFSPDIVDEIRDDSWITLSDPTMCGPYPLQASTTSFSTSSRFSLNCPTSLRNFGRLVRGMFGGRRPILLEGSPGAGKSSVVMALAHYTGQPICRINFSDQTELGDILGQNIPDIVDGKTFVWKDGILLEAISRGEWVLLDELNLAPQPVLEGLNALLDHRAEIYVPSIDKLVKCPQNFRIFATQNEAKKGDGRKMLPRSFLSRFNRVMVDPMGIDDLRIAALETITSDSDIVEKCIQVLTKFSASKWRVANMVDWNLRDITRLLKCPSPITESKMFLILAQKLVDVVDRENAMKMISEIYQSESFSCWIDVSKIIDGEGVGDRGTTTPDLLASQAPAVAGLALALTSGSHGIVTGQSGKKSVINLVHALVNPELPIQELCMHSQMDTSDLIGQFSQNSVSGEFVWVDSILTRLVRLGGWMVLTNAHACPPSILDRLNALIEDHGILVIPEKGTAEAIVPHPNFRLILATEYPQKLSHAIRNRCVEIFVDHTNVSKYDLLRVGISSGISDTSILTQLASQLTSIPDMQVCASLVSTGRVDVETALQFVGADLEVEKTIPGLEIVCEILLQQHSSSLSSSHSPKWFHSRQVSLHKHRDQISEALFQSSQFSRFVTEWYLQSSTGVEDFYNRLAVVGKTIDRIDGDIMMTDLIRRLVARAVLVDPTCGFDLSALHANCRSMVEIASRYPSKNLMCWSGLVDEKTNRAMSRDSVLLFTGSFRSSSVELMSKISQLLECWDMESKAAILCEFAATAIALRAESKESVVENEAKILNSVIGLIPSIEREDEENETTTVVLEPTVVSPLQASCDRLARLCGVNEIEQLIKCGAKIQTSDLILYGSRRVAAWAPEKRQAIEMESIYGELIGLVGSQLFSNGGKAINIHRLIECVDEITVEQLPKIIHIFSHFVDILRQEKRVGDFVGRFAINDDDDQLNDNYVSLIPSGDEKIRKFVATSINSLLSIQLPEYDIHTDCAIAISDMKAEIEETKIEIEIKTFCKDVAGVGSDSASAQSWKHQLETVYSDLKRSGIYIRSLASRKEYQTIVTLFDQVKRDLFVNLSNSKIVSKIVTSFVAMMSEKFEKFFADRTRPICFELMKIAYGIEQLTLHAAENRFVDDRFSVPVSPDCVLEISEIVEWSRIVGKLSSSRPNIVARLYEKIESEAAARAQEQDGEEMSIVQNDVEISLSSLVQNNDRATADEAVEKLRRQLFGIIDEDTLLSETMNSQPEQVLMSDWDAIGIALVASTDDEDGGSLLKNFLAVRGAEMMKSAINEFVDSPELVALNRLRLEQVIADLESRKSRRTILLDDTEQVADSVRDNREMKLRLREMMKKKTAITIDFYAPNGGAGAVGMVAKPLLAIYNFLKNIRDSVMEISDHPDLIQAISVVEKALNLPATTTSAITVLESAEHVFVSVEKFQKSVPSRYLTTFSAIGVSELMSVIAHLRANEIVSWKDLRVVRETIVAKSSCGKWLVHLLGSAATDAPSVFDLCLAWIRNSGIGQYRFRVSMLETVAEMTKNKYMYHAVGVIRLWEKSIETQIKSARDVLNKEVKALMKEIQFRLGGRHYSHEAFRMDTKRSHVQLASALKKFEEKISENCESFIPQILGDTKILFEMSLKEELDSAITTIRSAPTDKSAKALKNRILQDVSTCVREFLKDSLKDKLEYLGNREFSGELVVEEIMKKSSIGSLGVGGTEIPRVICKSMLLSQLPGVCKNLDVKPATIGEWRSLCSWSLRLLGEAIDAGTATAKRQSMAKIYKEIVDQKKSTPVSLSGDQVLLVGRVVEFIETARVFIIQANLLRGGKDFVTMTIPEIPALVTTQMENSMEEKPSTLICAREWLIDELPEILNNLKTEFFENRNVVDFFPLARNRFIKYSVEADELMVQISRLGKNVSLCTLKILCGELLEEESSRDIGAILESVGAIFDFTLFLHNEGLCSQEPQEEENQEGTTEWNDGTGLGSGSGMNDKSDEIEDAGQFDTMRGEKQEEQDGQDEGEKDLSKGIDANKDQGMEEDDVEEHNVEKNEDDEEEDEKDEQDGDREMGEVDLDKGGEIDENQGNVPSSDDDEEEEEAEEENPDNQVDLKNNQRGEEEEEDTRAAENSKNDSTGQSEENKGGGDEGEEDEKEGEEDEEGSEDDDQIEAVIDPSKLQDEQDDDENDLDDLQSIGGDDQEDDQNGEENGNLDDEELLDNDMSSEMDGGVKMSDDENVPEDDQVDEDAQIDTGAQDVDASAGGNDNGGDEHSNQEQKNMADDSKKSLDDPKSGKTQNSANQNTSSTADSSGGEIGKKNNGGSDQNKQQQQHKPAPSPLDPNNSEALDEWLKSIKELVGQKEEESQEKDENGASGDVGQMDDSADQATVAPTTSEVPGGKIDEQEGDENMAASEEKRDQDSSANPVNDQDIVMMDDGGDEIDRTKELEDESNGNDVDKQPSVKEEKRIKKTSPFMIPDSSDNVTIPETHSELPPPAPVVRLNELSPTIGEDILIEDQIVLAESRATRLTTDLSEKLMAVLEPTKRGRLEGFFKTGKRVSMRRVLSWIASDYRKEKFWLRRTKPSHRDYNVVICLDNTLSMRNNDVGELSLVCVSALSQALQLLEVGKVGVLSFGTEVREICPLGDAQNHTMTVRELMKEFGFNEESTSSFSDAFPSVIHKCGDEFQQVSAGDDSRGSLALIITDGRFDKDRCRPYVQELIAQGHIPVLIVMDSNKDESILSVTSVTFEEDVENGNKRRKLVRKPFLSQADCPFPFYAVIQEPSQLPSTLSDILKQWIEISHR